MEDELKIYQGYKDFINEVKDFKSVSNQNEPKKQTEKEEFFITKPNEDEQLNLTKAEYFEIIQTIEDDNIFLLENIQAEEDALELQIKQ